MKSNVFLVLVKNIGFYKTHMLPEQVDEARGVLPREQQKNHSRCGHFGDSLGTKVVTQVHVPPIFPPEHRVLLFAPEFGTDRSFDVAARLQTWWTWNLSKRLLRAEELWSYLEPEDQVDLSVVPGHVASIQRRRGSDSAAQCFSRAPGLLAGLDGFQGDDRASAGQGPRLRSHGYGSKLKHQKTTDSNLVSIYQASILGTHS